MHLVYSTAPADWAKMSNIVSQVPYRVMYKVTSNYGIVWHKKFMWQLKFTDGSTNYYCKIFSYLTMHLLKKIKNKKK